MAAELLAEAENRLLRYSPAVFDSPGVAWPECIEFLRAVEDEKAWKAAYSSVDEFYAAHEDKHPDIRLYGLARREMIGADPMTSPGGLPSARLARLREQHQG